MKKLGLFLFNVSVMAAMPVIAGAAGTYYNGNLYQNPQSRYGAGSGGYYNNYGAGRGYGQGMQTMGTNKQTAQKTKKSEKTSAKKQGFNFDVDLTHEFSNWNFNMKNAGSKLHYDNLSWNVLSGEGVYYFGDTTPMQLKFGAKYGKQFDKSTMVDDDISSEKMWEIQTINVETEAGLVQEDLLVGAPALSVGESKGGTQMGFNVAFGLTDFFSSGRVKFTPSIGYRYFKYTLETKSNYGMMVQVVDSSTFVNCLTTQGGEIQCSPYVAFIDNNGEDVSYTSFVFDTDGKLLLNPNGTPVVYNDAGAPQVNVGQTYYYEQSGTSHKYETEWAGPYVALDMEYEINANNALTAGIELGLPIYDSKGDQPYRIDWAHPTSVEDKGSLGDAIHLGLNTVWTTKISDSVGFSLGFTYDYYRVSGAKAITYLNPSENQAKLDEYQYYIDSDEYELTEEGLEEYNYLKELQSNGWKTEASSEIDSIYKSMGIRAGLSVKF